MPASVAQFGQVANWFATGAKSVGGLAWSSGDRIYVWGGIENAGGTIATPTNANLAFQLRVSVTTGGSNQCACWWWEAVAGSSQTGQTISMANPGGNRAAGIMVWVITGASGFANASANQTASAFGFTPSAGSVVLYGCADWNANQTNQTPTTGTGTATERVDTGDGATYGVNGADWQGVSATSSSFGLTSYSGMTPAHAVIEVLAAAGAGDITGAGQLTAPPTTSAGTGGVTVHGGGEAAPLASVATGSAAVAVTGGGQVTALEAAASAAGQVTVTGSGQASASAAAVDGDGTLGAAATTGAGQLTAPAAQAVGTGSVSVAGSGSLTAPAAVVDGFGGQLEPEAFIIGAVTGPAGTTLTFTGPASWRTTTGPAVRRALTGAVVIVETFTGPANDPPDLVGPASGRTVTGPESSRTLTGPGA